jgi:hypothetical protein
MTMPTAVTGVKSPSDTEAETAISSIPGTKQPKRASTSTRYARARAPHEANSTPGGSGGGPNAGGP